MNVKIGDCFIRQHINSENSQIFIVTNTDDVYVFLQTPYLDDYTKTEVYILTNSLNWTKANAEDTAKALQTLIDQTEAQRKSLYMLQMSIRTALREQAS